ncbi:helix-turn-helix domain-containing protein [Patescibacteria group bacterium]|nr:helix-turn-helix domain-containing protein [Patescibacteria group bacterium]MBU1682694.1 helix-turn-helix domain-containing protein [Patescibacteria group bacterium]
MEEKIIQTNGEVKLLRAGEVAQILNVSRAFAYRLMQQGKIRTVAIAKSRRVRPIDLQDFINQNLSPVCDYSPMK